MGHLLQVGALQWSHQMADLWPVFGSFCQQGRLQLRPVISHYKFVQGDLICCFARWQLHCPTAATLLVSSFPNKVRQFSFVYCPQSQKTSSEICHAPALGGWLVTPPPLSALVLHPIFTCWEFGSLIHFLSSSLHQHFTPSPLSVVDYNLLFMFFSFDGGVNPPRSYTGLC
jgi:hypothetical protein